MKGKGIVVVLLVDLLPPDGSPGRCDHIAWGGGHTSGLSARTLSSLFASVRNAAGLVISGFCNALWEKKAVMR